MQTTKTNFQSFRTFRRGSKSRFMLLDRAKSSASHPWRLQVLHSPADQVITFDSVICAAIYKYYYILNSSLYLLITDRSSLVGRLEVRPYFHVHILLSSACRLATLQVNSQCFSRAIHTFHSFRALRNKFSWNKRLPARPLELSCLGQFSGATSSLLSKFGWHRSCLSFLTKRGPDWNSNESYIHTYYFAMSASASWVGSASHPSCDINIPCVELAQPFLPRPSYPLSNALDIYIPSLWQLICLFQALRIPPLLFASSTFNITANVSYPSESLE